MNDKLICTNCGAFIEDVVACDKCGYECDKQPRGQLCAEPADRVKMLHSALLHLVERYEFFLGEYGYSDSAVREAKRILKECE